MGEWWSAALQMPWEPTLLDQPPGPQKQMNWLHELHPRLLLRQWFPLALLIRPSLVMALAPPLASGLRLLLLPLLLLLLLVVVLPVVRGVLLSLALFLMTLLLRILRFLLPPSLPLPLL